MELNLNMDEVLYALVTVAFVLFVIGGVLFAKNKDIGYNND